MKADPALVAKLDQVAADPEVVFELAFHGDFYVEVDEDGSVRHIPRPEEK